MVRGPRGIERGEMKYLQNLSRICASSLNMVVFISEPWNVNFLLTSLHYILEWSICAAFEGIGAAKSSRVDVPWFDHYVLQLVIHPHGANESFWHASAHLAGYWRLPCTCPSATIHRKRPAMDSIPRASKPWPFPQQPTFLPRQCYTSTAHRHQRSQRNLVLMPLNISALLSTKWFRLVSKRRI